MKNYPQNLRAIYKNKTFVVLLEDLILNPNKKINKDFSNAVSNGAHICFSLGVIDKNKTEVFECDVIEVPGNYSSPMKTITSVERCNTIGGGFICTGLAYISSSLILGNKHSNPELLKRIVKWS